MKYCIAKVETRRYKF